MKSGKQLIFNILWPLVCTYLVIISHLLYPVSSTQSFFGGEYYIGFYALYCLITYFLCRDWTDLPSLSRWSFLIGFFVLLFGHPLFENDHFRYLWEGKVIWSGQNPYRFAPNSEVLQAIVFEQRNRIGFDYLTTIYPPLTLLWFGLGSFLKFKYSLIFFMILNMVLMVKLFEIVRFRAKALHIILLMPLFIKEYVQAIHIDLLSFLFFIHSILYFQNRVKNIYLSFSTKYLGVIALFYYSLKELKQIKLKKILTILLLFSTVPLSMYFATNGFKYIEGASAFSRTWVWSPGFYSLLVNAFDISGELSRLICFLIFLCISILLALKLFKKQKSLEVEDGLKFYFYLFSSMMFFSPVYNGWYIIWYVIPALLLRRNDGVLYGVLSVLCYTYYWDSEYLLISHFLIHLPYLWIFKNGVADYLAEEQLAPPKTQN